LPEPHAEFCPDTYVFNVELECRRGEPVGWRMAFPGASTMHEVSESWAFTLHLDEIGGEEREAEAPMVLDAYGDPPDQYRHPVPEEWK
jgi:hypothetical protein